MTYFSASKSVRILMIYIDWNFRLSVNLSELLSCETCKSLGVYLLRKFMDVSFITMASNKAI